MLHTARIVLISVVCVFAVACAGKEDKPKEAPKKEETAAPKVKAPTPANPDAVKPVTGIAADPKAAEGGAEGETDEASGLVPQLQKLADKACACKDKACASAVQDEVATLMSEAKEPPKGETQTIANTMQKLQGCVAAAQK